MEIIQQLDLFASTNGTYKITKPIRLIECFSGIGAQAKALEILGIPFEHHKTCEWAYNSIAAYNAIHIKDKTNYSKDLTKKQLLDYLQGNISINYNEPANLSKKSEEWLRDCYNNVIATHDLMNICNVHGKDFEIDTNYTHIISWSYPCQDLSLSGTLKGMKEGSNTRSSLCFEFLRIISELSLEERKATVLIMENVPNAVGTKNIDDFKLVESKLRDLGYTNHIKILNLKNYGLPQNRERVFMVSCFGDYQFPAKIPLKYKLKDFLEKEVDEKYYLSDAFIDYASGKNYKNDKYDRSKAFNQKLKSVNKGGISGAITTREGGRSNDTFIQVETPLKKELCNELIEKGLVKENDIVKHSYTNQILSGNKKCAEKNNEMIALTTRGDCIGVVVKRSEHGKK